ncbi:MAG: PEP-CTERM sorting domain-containing protein [Phycisphaerales bacterium]|nr:PEP-CTERM sorting domain-containing protein [Phycisphaerales bacterium]
MKNVIALAALVAVAGASVASGDVITSWVNFGQPGNQAFSSVGTQAANVTGSNLVRGSGLTPSAASNAFSASNWQFGDSNDYFSFGFTVDSGYAVNLESLWIGMRSSNTGPGLMGLYYNGDGYSSALATFDMSPGSVFVNAIVDLSALSGLTGAVEFRLMMAANIAANGGSVSASGTYRVGDHFDGANFSEMRVTGTVVPTPASMALIGLGGLVAGRRRR